MASYQPPRGAVYTLKDENSLKPDVAPEYEDRMMEWMLSAKEEAIRTAKLNIELPRVPQYINYLTGEYWDVRRPKYKSTYSGNRLMKARVDTLSMLTLARPTIDVTSQVRAFDKQAQISSGIIQSEYQKHNMDVSLVTAADLAKLWGTSFWKTGGATPGSLSVSPCGPDSVMPIQPGWDIQHSTAVMYRTWKAPGFYRRVFPARSAGIEREATISDYANSTKSMRPANIDQYTWNALAPAMQRALGAKPGLGQSPVSTYAYKAIEHLEFWVDDPSINESRQPVLIRDPYLPLESHNYWYIVQPGERLYPRKRLIVYAGRRLMYDGPSPYWHGLYPFPCLRLNPVPWSFWGLSAYRDLVPIVKSINEVVAGSMDMIKRCLNPTAVTREGAVPITAWKEFFADMPGAKLRLGPLGNVANDIRYMEVPQLPSYVFEMLMRYLLPEFDRMSGMVDITAMSSKRQMPGGDTIEQIRDNLQTGTQLEERYLEVFLRDAGVQAVSNVFQFFTVEQRIKILGDDGVTLQDFDFDPRNMIPADTKRKEQHWRNFSLMVAPGSLRTGAKDRDKQIAMNLFKMQAISIDELLRKLDVTNIPQIKEEILEWMQKVAATQGAGQEMDPQMIIDQIMAQLSGGAAPPGGAPAGASGGGPPAGMPPPGETPRLTRGARNGQPY